ncbi:TrbI/VirB10 family protein [Roseivivax sediminis]|uniref:Type IV secretion system protein VirB10 n=1 Tax=Roseivivax sediminis TaxID=936889 RepID=A0A1I2E5A4_9RHOB|nr:TrbI/VirB10 family protein [Roseivivax sediminis]SFE87708.1 type IV secretion system protein VirB10 [Roseivivax sediminis]
MADKHQADGNQADESGLENGSEEKEYVVEGHSRRFVSGNSSTGIKVVFGIVVVGILAMMGYAMVAQDETGGSVETSDAREFQSGTNGGGFGDIGMPRSSEPEEDEGFDFGPIQDQLEDQRTALEERNENLQQQVRQLQGNLADLTDRAGSEDNDLVTELSQALEETQEQNAELVAQMRDEFSNQLQSLQAENENRMNQQEQRLEALRRENEALQTEITTATEDAAQEARDAEAERRRQQQREAELAERRRQRQEELEARVNSEAVIFDNGSGGGASNSGSSDGAASGASEAVAQLNPRGQSRDGILRDFVSNGGGGGPVSTEQAQQIANPENTVLQGTMIQATLENAVDSSLPGNVSAVVNYPVWSFDHSQVLIPSGSRLFGSYSSDVQIGQGRILVGWNRLVTPDGQSVELSAFGGDQMGRSGITGNVDTRFGTRFGNAALISLIGAGPSIAAAQVDDEASAQVANDIGNDLSDATTSAAAQYATLPPTISVEQGSSITVMVDRDLEFF